MSFNLIDYANRNNSTRNRETPSASTGGFSLTGYYRRKNGIADTDEEEEKRRREQEEAERLAARNKRLQTRESLMQPRVSYRQNEYTYTPGYTDTGSSNYSREDVLRMLADEKIAQEQEKQRQARNELRDQFMSERERQAQQIYDTYGVSEPSRSTPDMRVVKPSDGGVAAYTDTGSRNYSREDVERELGVYNILINNAKEDERKANRYENMSPDALKAEWQSKYDDRNAVWELLQTRVPYFDDVPYEGEENRSDVQKRRKEIANKYGLDLSNIDSFEVIKEALKKTFEDMMKQYQ